MNKETFAVLKILPEEGGDEIPLGYGNIASYKGQLIDIDGDGAGTSEDGHTIRDIHRQVHRADESDLARQIPIDIFLRRIQDDNGSRGRPQFRAYKSARRG